MAEQPVGGTAEQFQIEQSETEQSRKPWPAMPINGERFGSYFKQLCFASGLMSVAGLLQQLTYPMPAQDQMHTTKGGIRMPNEQIASSPRPLQERRGRSRIPLLEWNRNPRSVHRVPRQHSRTLARPSLWMAMRQGILAGDIKGYWKIRPVRFSPVLSPQCLPCVLWPAWQWLPYKALSFLDGGVKARALNSAKLRPIERPTTKQPKA